LKTYQNLEIRPLKVIIDHEHFLLNIVASIAANDYTDGSVFPLRYKNSLGRLTSDEVLVRRFSLISRSPISSLGF